MIDTIVKYWQIILFISGLIFHAIWVYMKVGQHEERITKLEERADDSDEKHSDYQAIFAEIRAKLDLLVEGFQTSRKK